jgi:hypothetical protein
MHSLCMIAGVSVIRRASSVGVFYGGRSCGREENLAKGGEREIVRPATCSLS